MPNTINQTDRTSNPTQARPAWMQGVIQALPIVMGYIPIGFAYGVLAKQSGLSMLNTLLMSIIVYAGSSQLISVSLFAAGVPGLSIIITTFIVNLRHMLFSAALSPYLSNWSKPELALFAYELTDESFAVHSTQFEQGDRPKVQVYATNITAQISWLVGGVLGALAGQLITDVRPYALDYTLLAMFIGLLVMQIKTKIQILVAIIGGVTAVTLTMWGLDQWSAILATIIAATAGVVIQTITEPLPEERA